LLNDLSNKNLKMNHQTYFIKNELKIQNYQKRMKFIRGKSFQGLKDYFESDSIKIYNKDIIYSLNQQLDLFQSEYGLRVKLSRFYEILTKGIYGGELKEQYGIKLSPLENYLLVEPDVSCKDFFRETKSISPGRCLQLKDEQMAKNFLLERYKIDLKKEIKFEIFRHGIKKLQSDYIEKDIEILFKKLADSTKFMISLPFRVIFDIYISGKCSRQKGNEKHDSYTRIDSSPINALLAYPEETLNYFNVELEGLKIIKSKLPEGMKLNNFEISPFPILIIKNVNSEKWSEKFNELIKNEYIFPREFNIHLNSFLNSNNKLILRTEPVEDLEEEFQPIPKEDVPF
jgi:hypothetical protein